MTACLVGKNMPGGYILSRGRQRHPSRSVTESGGLL